VDNFFLLTAYDINARTIERIESGNASIVTTTPLTVDPISDLVNNVRFALNGFGPDHDTAAIEMRTRSFFKLQIPEAARITVLAYLAYNGLSTLTARGVFTGLPPDSSTAELRLSAQLRVRVRGANQSIVFTQHSPRKRLFDKQVGGFLGINTTTNTDLVSAGLCEESLTVAPPDVVLPEDTIFVRIEYNIESFAGGNAVFVADFDPGGLNVPMVVVNY
jgi:hypothetical protein